MHDLFHVETCTPAILIYLYLLSCQFVTIVNSFIKFCIVYNVIMSHFRINHLNIQLLLSNWLYTLHWMGKSSNKHHSV